MTQFHQESDQLHLLYDTESELGTITYQKILTPHITAEAYHWLYDRVMDGSINLPRVKGLIYDFREVLKFEPGNFQAVKRESQRMNEALDLSHFPVALVVGNLFQEEMVRVASKITGQETRIKIVHSDEEAMTFINDWHREKQRGEDEPTPEEQ